MQRLAFATAVLLVALLAACSSNDPAPVALGAGDPAPAGPTPSEIAPASDTPPTVTPIPDPTSTPIQLTPTPTPVPLARFAADQPLTMNPAGTFGYYGAASDSGDGRFPCSDRRRDALVGFDFEASRADRPVLFNARLTGGGQVLAMSFLNADVAAVIMTCDDPQTWLTVLNFGGDTEPGHVASRGSEVPLINLGTTFRNLRWIDTDTVSFESHNGDGPASTVELDVRTGSHVTSDLVRFATGPAFTTSDGAFTYSAAPADPSASDADARCGSGAPLNLLMVNEGLTPLNPRSALLEGNALFVNLDDMAFGPDGLVMWSTTCGAGTDRHDFIGRRDAGGSIIDAHEVDLRSGPAGAIGFVRVHSEFDPTGTLVIWGYGPGLPPVPVVIQYDDS